MEANPHYRYIRSLGWGASLYAVTPPGIDEFLAGEDADRPGVVVLSFDRDDEGRDDHILGGPRIRDLLRHVGRMDPARLEAARPIGVVSVDAQPGDQGIGLLLADRLRAQADRSHRRAARPALGDPRGLLDARTGLLAALPEALSHVIGADPFAEPPTLN